MVLPIGRYLGWHFTITMDQQFARQVWNIQLYISGSSCQLPYSHDDARQLLSTWCVWFSPHRVAASLMLCCSMFIIWTFRSCLALSCPAGLSSYIVVLCFKYQNNKQWRAFPRSSLPFFGFGAASIALQKKIKIKNKKKYIYIYYI